MYDDILIPTDGSESVQRAIDHAIDLAATTGATIHALFVVDTADIVAMPDAQWVAMEDVFEERGEEAVDDVAERARQRDVPVTTAVEQGSPHEEIVDYADANDVALIVMGTHGRSGIDRVLLGSVTENVIRHAETPVLVQRIEERV